MIINSLPNELLETTFSFLRLQDLHQLASVSSTYRKLANDEIFKRYSAIAKHIIFTLNHKHLADRSIKYSKHKKWLLIRRSTIHAIKKMTLEEINHLLLTSAPLRDFSIIKVWALTRKLKLCQENPQEGKKIVQHLAEEGHHKLALKLIESLQIRNSEVLEPIVDLFKEKSDLIKIRKIVPILSNPFIILHKLYRVVEKLQLFDLPYHFCSMVLNEETKILELAHILEILPNEKLINQYLPFVDLLSEKQKPGALLGLVKNYAKAGKIAKAMEILNTFSNDLYMYDGLKFLLSKLPNLMEIDRIFQLALTLENSNHNDILCTIASTYAEFGEIDKALEILSSLQRISSIWRFVEALERIIRQLEKDDQRMVHISELYQKCSANPLRDLELARLSGSFLKFGNLEFAIETARRIRDNDEKLNVYLEILVATESAEVLKKIKDFTQSIPFKHFDWDFRKNRYYHTVIKRYLSIRRFDKAFHYCQFITDKEIKRLAINDIIIKSIPSECSEEDSNASLAILDQVVETIHAIPEIERVIICYDQTFFILAEKFAILNEFERAIEIASEIKKETEKNKAKRQMVLKIPEINEEKIIQHIGDEYLIFAKIRKVCDLKEYEQALELACRINDEELRKNAFLMIAKETPDVKMLYRLVELTRNNKSTLLYLVDFLAKNGLIEEAIAVVQRNSYEFLLHIILRNLPIRMDILDQLLQMRYLIDDLHIREDVLEEISMKFAECNDFRKALSVAYTLDHNQKAICHISRKFLECGAYEKAVKVLEYITSKYDRVSAMVKISNAFADIGRFDLARELAYKIRIQEYNGPEEMIKSLMYIKKKQFENNLDFVNILSSASRENCTQAMFSSGNC